MVYLLVGSPSPGEYCIPPCNHHKTKLRPHNFHVQNSSVAPTSKKNWKTPVSLLITHNHIYSFLYLSSSCSVPSGRAQEMWSLTFFLSFQVPSASSNIQSILLSSLFLSSLCSYNSLPGVDLCPSQGNSRWSSDFSKLPSHPLILICTKGVGKRILNFP